jgi:2-polyprenyl-6-methoxyphenol hydroxylase-like FAD-dependent oxidoreductase
MYDVIVVGARCAGASLAMLLARAGHRVALVDRASFPSDTMSTHFLWQRGAARLQAWGLLDRLEARGCAPIREITFDVGPVQLSGTGPAVGSFVVSDLLWSESRVAGVRGHSRGSGESSLRASIVVGADGLHSTVARRVAASAYRAHAPLTAAYYSYWSGMPDLGASFHSRPGRLILAWPTNDDLTCIYVAWPHREFHQVRTDVAASFHTALRLVPALHDAVAAGRQEQRFTGTGDLPNFYRASAGPGWALAGDAGHHKDPCTGMGMSDAFLSADLLAEAINDGLAGRRPMQDALASYQHQRDALTTGGFELALSTARLAPLSPRVEAFYRAAADQPEMTRSILGVLGGTIPPGNVYGESRAAGDG